ncbi:ribose-5-phosphate isomerase RpiA [Puia dinghuensis]|uniref:Ribose-5-phosphate isomerase A n=1 Tax=Puia dinghuensis TaxID=1792502 RepID=A0A8J2UIJ1_9BACT|nr:ribose-5-phosphate isomerase RpiA [Puia dinghuensis]GGB22405.1 ribose-5-phosphate isomerase A [Puia dinghuensis]
MDNQAVNSKKIAAGKAIEYIRNGMTLGLGTGSTAYWAIQGIGEMVKHGLSVKAVATSIQSESLARELNIPLIPFSEVDRLDITIDGADEVDEKLNLIKGGGGALLREKIVAAATRFYIIIVDESKLVRHLGKFPLPVEVAPFGWELTMRRLSELNCTPRMRMAGDKPFLTDNQHYILDCAFGEILDPAGLHRKVSDITGVMEDGFFINMADIVVAGSPGGETRILNKPA